MKYRFIERDGTITMRELEETQLAHKIVDHAPQTEYYTLARAMFDHAFEAEARVKGEGNIGRALDIMWNKTKPKEAVKFLTDARDVVAKMPPIQKTYILHGCGKDACYIEVGTVFVDPTPKSADAEFEKNLAEARQQQLFAQGNPPPTQYPKLPKQQVQKDWKTERAARWESVLQAEDAFVAQDNARP